MPDSFRIGHDYRNRGIHYKHTADDPDDPDEFLSTIAQPVLHKDDLLSPLAGMKFLDTYANNPEIGPHSVVVLVTDTNDDLYPDEIDTNTGEVHYWGDAKRQTPTDDIDIDSFPGNNNLAPYIEDIRNGRYDRVPPILLFEKRQSGSVTFLGLCTLNAVTRDTYRQEYENYNTSTWTPNYRFHLTILDVPSVNLNWIYNRITDGTDEGAPAVWQSWKESGSIDQRDRYTDSPTEEDDYGVEYVTSGSEVRISKRFRDRVFDLYDGKCALTQMQAAPLVTLAHIVPRSDAIEYAEDIENVLLLNWTHHKAFDAGLWTLDEDLRIRVNPEFTTDDPHLRQTLIDRQGEQIELPDGATLSPDRINEHNEELDWF